VCGVWDGMEIIRRRCLQSGTSSGAYSISISSLTVVVVGGFSSGFSVVHAVAVEFLFQKFEIAIFG
jgi:hypothetical protein